MLGNRRFFGGMKTAICFVLLLSLVVGCGGKPETKQKKKVIKKIIVVQSDDEAPEENGNSDGGYDFGYTDTDRSDEDTASERRQLYSAAESTEAVKPDTVKAEYAVKAYPWSGPAGYVIVYPAGNRLNRGSADKLSEYFKKAGITLNVTDDTAAVSDKEILVGNTNRFSSGLAENEYRVALADGKLIFEGGHDAMTEEAVKWFTASEYSGGKVNLLTGKCESFSASAKNGYKYVWGDEFGGNALDMNKWSFNSRMGGTNKMPILSDSSVVNVNEGLLKMSAVRYYNASRPMAEYATNMTISSEKSMSWKYGYLEMRAMVPYNRGAWPSLWAVSDGAIGNERSMADYFVEVDIFEVFSSANTATPNIHKWYNSGEHTQYNGLKSTKRYTFGDWENLRYEYHTYGFEWTPDKMTMSVDGVDYCSYDLNDNYDGKSDMSGFRDNLFILLNNHIYAPDLSYTTSSTEVNNRDLPFDYFVDYIRLYQKSGEGSVNYAE